MAAAVALMRASVRYENMRSGRMCAHKLCCSLRYTNGNGISPAGSKRSKPNECQTFYVKSDGGAAASSFSSGYYCGCAPTTKAMMSGDYIWAMRTDNCTKGYAMDPFPVCIAGYKDEVSELGLLPPCNEPLGGSRGPLCT